MEKCKFYEVDTAAQAEGEAMAAAYEAGMSDAEREAMDAWAAQAPSNEPDPFAKCGEYCKHLKSGKGHPGEYVYHCAAPGNEHIIDVDFREYEII
jgi:hypothetical protein